MFIGIGKSTAEQNGHTVFYNLTVSYGGFDILKHGSYVSILGYLVDSCKVAVDSAGCRDVKRHRVISCKRQRCRDRSLWLIFIYKIEGCLNRRTCDLLAFAISHRTDRLKSIAAGGEIFRNLYCQGATIFRYRI